MTAPPILIAGGGLAGTALGWALHERGVPFLIVDPNEAGTCSKIAAGLVTPITGKRVKPSWRVGELLPVALALYRRVEMLLGGEFYHERPLVRLFKEAHEVEWWRGRADEPGLDQWVDAAAPLVDPALVHSEFGGFVQRQAGWLDTAAYLEASRAFFENISAWRQGVIAEEEVDASENGVLWQGEDFSHVVFCRGAEQRTGSRFFSWLKFDCARGVIASLKVNLAEVRIINRGCWLLPHTAGHWRAGSTYEFDLTTPMETSIADLHRKLSLLLRIPFEMSETQAGIRPIIKHRQLVLGRHPAHPRVCVFNGLGSKGVLRAPYFAKMLAEHLLDDKPLEPVVDVRAND
ncbi:MAG: FAD-binding oxidoreductase [Verrucomicrobia bacterium]|nr:FAD-binding oxidoreductase [Verrucomicrobiota bacterium]